MSNGLTLPFAGTSSSTTVPAFSVTNNAAGIAIAGTSSGAAGVSGTSQSSQYGGVVGNNNSGGPGVYGSANGWDGVHGESQSNQHAGVSGINYSGGPGVGAQGTPAGSFQGNVLVTACIGIGGEANPVAPLHITGPVSTPPGSLSSTDNGLLVGGAPWGQWIQSYGLPLAL